MGSGLTAQMNSASGAFKLAGSLGAFEKTQALSARDAYCQKKIDVWFAMGADWSLGSGSKALFGISQFGVDYRWGDGVLIGVMAQSDQMSVNTGTAGYRAQGWGVMAGPYAALKLGKGVMFDMRVLGGVSHNTISPYATYSDAFSTKRWLAAARLSGRWNLGAYYVMPSVEYVHYVDQSKAYVDALGAEIDSQRTAVDQFVFGPTIGFQSRIMDDRVTLMSFVEAKGRWDMSPSGNTVVAQDGNMVRQSQLRGSLGVGFAMRDERGKALSLRSTYNGFSTDGVKSVSLMGQISVPFR